MTSIILSSKIWDLGNRHPQTIDEITGDIPPLAAFPLPHSALQTGAALGCEISQARARTPHVATVKDDGW
jgi:hypothetical protein